MKPLQAKDIINAIVEYRKAFWAHRDLAFMQEKRYSPVVGWRHISQHPHKAMYQVWLSDTWVHMPQKGMFSLAKEEVPNSTFKSESLEMALQELLNFCRVHFMNDKLFNKIKNFELAQNKQSQGSTDVSISGSLR